MEPKIDAWWFAASDRLPHGDNRPIVIGETHSVTGEILLCMNALHASRDPSDALQHATGPFLYHVRSWGSVKEDVGKLGSRHREYVAMRDATPILRQFAREQALSVIHLWDAPRVVREYLRTGDEALRATARAAVRAGAAPSHSVAWEASWAAVWGVGEGTAWGAARGAALAAVGAAEGAAAARATARTRFNELVTELFAA